MNRAQGVRCEHGNGDRGAQVGETQEDELNAANVELDEARKQLGEPGLSQDCASWLDV